ncbi:MAG: TVP38/TMEM64 family protein [Pseudomonadota bacterium]
MTDPATPRARRGLHARELVIGLAVLAVVAIGGVSGKAIGEELQHLRDWLASVGQGPVALAAGGALVAALFFIGTPQAVIIVAAVLAFGPWTGLAVSWAGKMVACLMGFAVGRRFGAPILARYSSGAVARAMAVLSREGGLVACAVVRMIPTVPSVLVNIAAGAAPIRLRDFVIGTALGSVPIMALTAFAGETALRGLQGRRLEFWIGLAVTAVGWALTAWLGAWLWKAVQRPDAPAVSEASPGDRR